MMQAKTILVPNTFPMLSLPSVCLYSVSFSTCDNTHCQLIPVITEYVSFSLSNIFMDSFQGCYKDGTEPGTRDCRWFASVFFLARFGMALTYAFTKGAMYFVIFSIMLVLIILLLTV